jgi:hypothetical protein
MERLQPTPIPMGRVIVTAQVGVNPAAAVQACWQPTRSERGELGPACTGKAEATATLSERGSVPGRWRRWTPPATTEDSTAPPVPLDPPPDLWPRKVRMSNKVVGDVDPNRPEVTLSRV